MTTDYKTLKQAVADYLQSIGVTYTAVFVPQSASRNSTDKQPSINWRVTFTRQGKQAIATDYTQGIGHIPRRPQNSRLAWHAKADTATAETGTFGGYNSASYNASRLHKLPAPYAADVMYSLLLDASASDESFDDWCSNLGYSSDSRKAEAAYNECRAIGMRMCSMFTKAEIEALRELTKEL